MPGYPYSAALLNAAPPSPWRVAGEEVRDFGAQHLATDQRRKAFNLQTEARNLQTQLMELELARDPRLQDVTGQGGAPGGAGLGPGYTPGLDFSPDLSLTPSAPPAGGASASLGRFAAGGSRDSAAPSFGLSPDLLGLTKRPEGSPRSLGVGSLLRSGLEGELMAPGGGTRPMPTGDFGRFSAGLRGETPPAPTVGGQRVTVGARTYEVRPEGEREERVRQQRIQEVADALVAQGEEPAAARSRATAIVGGYDLSYKGAATRAGQVAERGADLTQEGTIRDTFDAKGDARAAAYTAKEIAARVAAAIQEYNATTGRAQGIRGALADPTKTAGTLGSIADDLVAMHGGDVQKAWAYALDANKSPQTRELIKSGRLPVDAFRAAGERYGLGVQRQRKLAESDDDLTGGTGGKVVIGGVEVDLSKLGGGNAGVTGGASTEALTAAETTQARQMVAGKPRAQQEADLSRAGYNATEIRLILGR